jgi:hypothetical protein
MIRRALKRDVQRDLEAVRARRGDECAEIVQRAKLQVQRLVTAFGSAGPACRSRLMKPASIWASTLRSTTRSSEFRIAAKLNEGLRRSACTRGGTSDHPNRSAAATT